MFHRNTSGVNKPLYCNTPQMKVFAAQGKYNRIHLLKVELDSVSRTSVLLPLWTLDKALYDKAYPDITKNVATADDPPKRTRMSGSWKKYTSFSDAPYVLLRIGNQLTAKCTQKTMKQAMPRRPSRYAVGDSLLSKSASISDEPYRGMKLGIHATNTDKIEDRS